MQKFLLILSILVAVSCATTRPIDYESSRMSLTDAISAIDRLTMTQRQGWRPDYIEINDKYIIWGEGTVTQTKGSAIGVGIVAIGRTTSNTRIVGERLYYDSKHSIVLSSWSGDHYLVSIRNEDHKIVKHVFRTSNFESAKRYVDAIETLVSILRRDSELLSDVVMENAEDIDADKPTGRPPVPQRDRYDELERLKKLLDDGALTQDEYEREKAKILSE